MEFPNLGKHCNEATCNRLDFLPLKCDACNKVFCSTHFNYMKHECPGAFKKDIQVPICPLCGDPVPTAPGVEPDITVGQHIDKQCKSDSRKIYTNRCNAKGCKRKELIPVTCTQCRFNFCLRHRHTADHDCKALINANAANTGDSAKSIFKFRDEKSPGALAAKAAEYRRQNKPTTLFNINSVPNRPTVSQANTATVAQATQVQTVQGNLSEDEALARAIALSIMELDESADRNRRNNTATNNAQRVHVGGRDNQHNNSKDKCSLS